MNEMPDNRKMNRLDENLSERHVMASTLTGLPSFGALIASKVVVLSSSSTYFAVDQHLIFQLALPHLMMIEFDEAWYLDTYSDINEAVAGGVLVSAHLHYLRHGYYEHRLPREILVDEEWYVSAHRDVRDAIAQRHYVSGQEHFERAGFREGRLPYPDFVLCQTI